MTPGDIDRLEQLAFAHGRSYDAYLVMDLDRQYFWGAGGTAVLGFVLRRKYAVVIGGLIGPDAVREALLTEFMSCCTEQGWTACFGLVQERDLPLFDRWGFESTKIGEDALISLPECTWQGHAYEWVRRQSNFCQRQGLVCSELFNQGAGRDETPDHAAELIAISEQFLDRTPHGRTMRYFVGRFDPASLYRRRLFAAIAERGAGRVEGFVVCTPYRTSREGRAWGIETYRSRGDAVRGTTPFLMRAVLQMLKDEGASEASLCLMPAAGVVHRRQPPFQDSWLIHTYIRVTHRYLNFILDTPGIAHYKTRFRPRRESIYCSIWPRASVGPLHAILSTWGTLEFSLTLALRRGLRRLRDRRQRATLSRI